MRTIDVNNVTETSEEKLNYIYENDKKAFDDFVSSKTTTMDYAAIKRLVISELALKNSIRPQRICGFSRQQIINMANNPERYGKHIIRLMDYMYLKSGYMRRLIDYFSNMPLLRYNVDTEPLSQKYFTQKQKTLKINYISFCAQASKYNLGNNINNIAKRMYLHDACYAYVDETPTDISYWFIDPKYCEIQSIANGNVLRFAINRSMLVNNQYYDTLPPGLQQLIEESYDISKNNLVVVPHENSFCVKYNANFTYLYPPFFPIIADILLIDEYKDLAKTKAVNDAYKLLVLKLPTKDGQLTMGNEITSPFISAALQVVQENIGVLPVPFDTDSIEFSSSNVDDRDKVTDATDWMYAEGGVSKALMSGATSGSELQASISVDQCDIFSIYRQLENWVALQQKLRGYVYGYYQFVYKILDITHFNEQEVIDRELKLAQSGTPNKTRMCAAAGISPSAMFGNTVMEQQVFADIFEMWQPLKTSYVQSGDEESSGGRPTVDDTELSESGETARENDTNLAENRV